jgi:hypothetical protein
MKQTLALVLLVFGSFGVSLQAHSGNTNSDNCHKNNRFNEYHCHNSNFQPSVKQSKSMLCHKKGSTYYSRTKNFIPFTSLQECIDTGGRMPKK